MKRYASTIALHSALKEKYVDFHRHVWPDVSAMIGACNIKNFTIFMRTMPDNKDYLFMYYEYDGADYEADIKKMAADPETQKWWDLVMPCQDPLPNRAEGEWWAAMEEICRID